MLHARRAGLLRHQSGLGDPLRRTSCRQGGGVQGARDRALGRPDFARLRRNGSNRGPTDGGIDGSSTNQGIRPADNGLVTLNIAHRGLGVGFSGCSRNFGAKLEDLPVLRVATFANHAPDRTCARYAASISARKTSKKLVLPWTNLSCWCTLLSETAWPDVLSGMAEKESQRTGLCTRAAGLGDPSGTRTNRSHEKEKKR